MGHAISARKIQGIYLALVIAALSAPASVVMVYAMLATLNRVFGNPATVAWVVTAYFLVGAVAAAVCGRFGDILGRRRMLNMVLAGCLAGAVLSACASNLAVVIAGAALQGLAGAVVPLAIGIAREALPADRVPFGINVVTATATIGGGALFLVGGVVVDHYSWRGGFWAAVAFVLAGIAASLICLPPSARQHYAGRWLDTIPGLLFVPALVGLLLVVERIGVWGWGDRRTIGILLASLLLLAYWWRDQARRQHPLIDVRLLVNRQIALANLCMAFAALGVMQFGQIMQLFFQQPGWTMAGFGLSATAAGALMPVFNLTGLISGPWSSRISARHGARQTVIYTAPPIILAWAALSIYHAQLWFVVVAVLVSQFGFTALYGAIFTLVVEATPAQRTAEATGMCAVFTSAFMAIGAKLVTAGLATSTVADPAGGVAQFPTGSAYALVFAYVAASSLLVLVCAFLLPRRQAVGTLAQIPAGNPA